MLCHARFRAGVVGGSEVSHRCFEISTQVFGDAVEGAMERV
jgi:hypothetical protein